MNLRPLFVLVLLSSVTVSAQPHIERTIACEETEELPLSRAFDAFLALLAKRELKPTALQFPARLALPAPNGFILSRSFYISPNELRGFEIFVPRDCVLESSGVLVSSTDLVIEQESHKQGITCFILKKK